MAGLHRPLAAALLALAASCGKAAPAPSVLLITVDALRADHLGAYGDAAVDTPNLDALLADALVFENAWTVVPITAPSLASLLTARTPRGHGVLNDAYDLEGSEPTLATALRDHGRRTAAFVPASLADKPGFERGFERYEPLSAAPEDATKAHDEELVRRAVEFINEVEAAGEPWFVWVHLNGPRAPYAPGAELEAKHFSSQGAQKPSDRARSETFGETLVRGPEDLEATRALYRGEVERADRALGPLLDRVAAAHGCVVTVLAADHGEMLYEHLNYVGHTAWLHEPILRVPLAFHVGGGAPDSAELAVKIAPGRRADPVTQLDIAPSLLGLLSLSFQSPDGGLDVLRGTAPADRLIVHETFAPEAFRDKIAVRKGTWKLQQATGPFAPGSTGADYRLIIDLAADPTEHSVPNPAAAGARVAELMNALHEWEARHPDPATLRKSDLDDKTRGELEPAGYEQGAILPEDAQLQPGR